MEITLLSFLSAIGWHSAAVLIIYFMRKFDVLRQRFHIFIVLALYLWSLLRMFLPFDYANAIVLKSEKIYPIIYDVLRQSYAYKVGLSLSLYYILMLIWFSGALLLLIRYISSYQKAAKAIIRYAHPCGAREQRLLAQAGAKSGKRIAVYSAQTIDTPLGLGIFRKMILLPDKYYTDDELRYILLHEYTHFRNHDVLIKQLVSVFCIIFWWNPIVYLLKKDLEQTLEIKCDLTVAKKLSIRERSAYLRTIISTLKDCPDAKKIPYASTALLRQTEEQEVKERFQMVLRYDAGRRRSYANAVILCGFSVLMLLSYLMIVQPAYEPPPYADGVDTIAFDSSNAYVLHDENERYWLYIDECSPIQIETQEVNFYREQGFMIMRE